MNTFQLRSLGLLCLMFVLPTAARAADRDHTIRDVPYFDMRGGFCTPTVLRMNFEFHGLKVPATVLQNWSWNYGFHLNDQKRISFPTTDPVEQIEHAAAVLGYETTVHTHDSLAAATARIKSLVDQDVPAIVQWIPHSVLAVGYEGDRLLIHDPRDVLAPEEGKVFGAGLESAAGAVEHSPLSGDRDASGARFVDGLGRHRLGADPEAERPTDAGRTSRSGLAGRGRHPPTGRAAARRSDADRLLRLDRAAERGLVLALASERRSEAGRRALCQ
jgi:hypothetical protein